MYFRVKAFFCNLFTFYLFVFPLVNIPKSEIRPRRLLLPSIMFKGNCSPDGKVVPQMEPGVKRRRTNFSNSVSSWWPNCDGGWNIFWKSLTKQIFPQLCFHASAPEKVGTRIILVKSCSEGILCDAMNRIDGRWPDCHSDIFPFVSKERDDKIYKQLLGSIMLK